MMDYMRVQKMIEDEEIRRQLIFSCQSNNKKLEAIRKILDEEELDGKTAQEQLDAIKRMLQEEEKEEVAFLPGAMVVVRLGDIKVPTICTGSPSDKFDSFFRLVKPETKNSKLDDNYVILVMGDDNNFREYYSREIIHLLDSENTFDKEYGFNAIAGPMDFYDKYTSFSFPIDALYVCKYSEIDNKMKQIIGKNEGKEAIIVQYINSLMETADKYLSDKENKLYENDRAVAYTENIIYDIQKKKTLN